MTALFMRFGVECVDGALDRKFLASEGWQLRIYAEPVEHARIQRGKDHLCVPLSACSWRFE